MRLILIIFLLSACGEQYEPTVEWSGNITERSERFILSYDDAVYPVTQIHKIETWWLEVQECAGVSIDTSSSPLTIEYSLDIPRDILGVHIAGDRYVRVYLYDLSFGYTTKHEMLHDLLYLIDGTVTDENHSHSHELFKICDL